MKGGVVIDEIGFVFLSFGGLRAAGRHWLRRKEENENKNQLIHEQQNNNLWMESTSSTWMELWNEWND